MEERKKGHNGVRWVSLPPLWTRPAVTVTKAARLTFRGHSEETSDPEWGASVRPGPMGSVRMSVEHAGLLGVVAVRHLPL